jgi:hypothetical protein
VTNCPAPLGTGQSGPTPHQSLLLSPLITTTYIGWVGLSRAEDKPSFTEGLGHIRFVVRKDDNNAAETEI